MIARIWRGAVRAEDAAAYAAYVQETGIAGYQRTPGNRGAWALWRVDGDRAEIVTVSMWESRSVIEGFAGQDIDQAVFYPEDDRYLIERDLTVSHYEVAGRSSRAAHPGCVLSDLAGLAGPVGRPELAFEQLARSGAGQFGREVH